MQKKAPEEVPFVIFGKYMADKGDSGMDKKGLREHIIKGITAAAVVTICILFWYCLQNLDLVISKVRLIFDILTPIIYGAVLAYLVAPFYNRSSNLVKEKMGRISKDEKLIRTTSKLVGTICSIFFVVAVIVGMFWLLIPQLLESIIGIKEAFPTYIENVYLWIKRVWADNPEIETFVLENFQTYMASLEAWAETRFAAIDMGRIGDILKTLSGSVMGVVNFIGNCFIGLIVMVYLLNIKDVLTGQGKKIIYGCLRLDWANEIVEEIRFVHRVFSGFIIGKLLDSLIIGIICFVAVSLMKMPFPLLLSVIIGVTNVIPFFGPFIGAIPTAILVFLVSPVKCIYFLLWILLLQQFDGNILGPRILGDSTGLSSFWVLFSILLFGGLFGFIGMIIAVPLFAVIYDLIARIVHYRLRRKKLPLLTEEYKDLDHIDEKNGTFIK